MKKNGVKEYRKAKEGSEGPEESERGLDRYPVQ